MSIVVLFQNEPSVLQFVSDSENFFGYGNRRVRRNIPEDYSTLGAESFAGRKFHNFRIFWHFLQKFLPRHNLNSKFAKVSACEITENS